jgi:uncharacterized membrane protein
MNEMKKIRISSTVTAILGFMSLIALVLMYLALSDISKEPDTIPEWEIVRFCWITIFLFVISTFITIGYMLKIPGLWKNDRTY